MSLDALRGGFIRMCFDPSLNSADGQCRMLFEGQYYDPGTGCTITPDTVMKITSTRDIDCQFGEGSVLAESLKEAFSCCGNNAVEIHAVARADAAGATAAEYTLTITGGSTTAGRIDIYWGEGDWNISVFVAAGQTETQIAAAILAAIPAGFPLTGVAAAGVITFTARNAGTVMNNMVAINNWHERNNYAPEGVAIAWAQTVVGATNPVALDYNAVLGECCYCCIGMLYDDVAWQDGMISYIEDAWSCDKPQCFGHGYTYNSGTLGEILATDTNSAEVSRLAHATTSPILGWLKVAAYTSHSCCLTVDNPEQSVQGPDNGQLQCLKAPESCLAEFTFDEQEQLRDAGFVVTVPVSGGAGALTSPFITNDITNYRFDEEGRPNLTFKDVNSRRLAANTAQEFAEFLQQFNSLGLFTRNTELREGVRGTNPRLMLGRTRAWAKENVGILFSEFDDIDNDITLQTDFEVAPECQGEAGKLHVSFIYRPPVRIGEIRVNMRPRLLDNCA